MSASHNYVFTIHFWLVNLQDLPVTQPSCTNIFECQPIGSFFTCFSNMQIVCLSVCLSVCQPYLKSDASEVQHPKLWEFEDHITPIVWFVGDRVSHETAVGKHRHRHTPHNGVPGRTVLVFTSEQVMHSAQMHLPLPTSTDAPPLTHLNTGAPPLTHLK